MRAATLLLTALMLAATTAQAQVPRTLGYQGRLLKADGSPVAGVTEITFAIYPGAEGGGTRLWSETQRLLLSDGYYAANLGDVTPLPDAVFEAPDRFLEITVGLEALLPRQRFSSVAFAIRADLARSVDGGPVNATSLAINGVPVIDSTGRLTGTAAYSAGAGISIDASGRTIGLLGSCQNGEVLKKNGSSWVCAADVGNAYAAGSGLHLEDNTFSLNACAAGQILKWSGSEWACATDLNPNYAPGSGLALTGNTFSLTKGCASGEILKYDGFVWACAPDDSSSYRAGTGVAIAGNAISLTKACLSGEILKYDGAQWNCSPDENTKLQQGAGIALTGTVVSLKKSCNATEVLKWDGADWNCAPDNDTRYLGGDGLLLDGKTFSLTKDCTLGQMLKWNGTTWACGADKDTTYVAGTGVVLEGNAFSITKACGNGEILRWNGAAWVCAADKDTLFTAGVGLQLSSTNSFSLLTSCTAGQLLKWDGTTWACATDSVTKYAAAIGSGLQLSGTNDFSLLTSCTAGQLLKWDGTKWACGTDNDTTSSYTAGTGGGLQLTANSFSLTSACATNEILKWDGTKWACSAEAVTSVSADSTGAVTIGGTARAPTLGVDPKKVQTRVAGTCAVGTAVTAVNQDGTVVCGTTIAEPQIRWATWSTFDQGSNWIASNNAAMFGGVAPQVWGDGNGRAYQMSNTADSMRTLFNKKLSVNANLNVVADTWYPYSSTNSKHTGVLMRVNNSTSAAITWTPCFYYTSYAGWSEYASASLNGASTWDSGGSDQYSGAQACPSLSIPANRTSTFIVISASSPTSGSRTNFLAFYNNSLTLPSGLTYVDDLGPLPASTNIWAQ
jgi:hypothetical protein